MSAGWSMGWVSLAAVEVRLLPLYAASTCMISFSAFVVEQWIITSYCLELLVEDCSDDAVGVQTAQWMRWFNLAGSITAFITMPFVGLLSDSVKASDAGNSWSRSSIVFAQACMLSLSLMACGIQAMYNLPRSLLLGGAIASSSLGGVFAFLPTIFALRADLCAPEQQPAAFLRVELSMFIGISVGIMAAGAAIGDSTDPHSRAVREPLVLGFAMLAWMVLLVALWLLSACSAPHGRSCAQPQEDTHNICCTSSCAREEVGQTLRSLREIQQVAREHGRYLSCILVSFAVFSSSNGLSGGLLLYYNHLGWSPRQASHFSAEVVEFGAVQLVLAQLLLTRVSREIVLCVASLGGMLGYVCLASRDDALRHLYPPLTSMSFVGFPIIRAIVASLTPADRAQTSLTALGITEHLAASASSFGFLTLFGAYMDSSTPELPVLIAAGIYAVGALSAAKAVLIAHRASGAAQAAARSRPPLLL